MTEATERATYYEKNKQRIAQQQKAHREIPEVKERIREREKQVKLCIPVRLIIHEELLKKDRERLKTTFIQEQIETLNLNTNKINKYSDKND